MRLSFMTMNRFMEKKAGDDAEYAGLLRAKGKTLLSDGRALRDEALLAKLQGWQLIENRAHFLQISERFLAAEEMARNLAKHSRLQLSGSDEDWVWIACTCLWERWLPERPCMEMIDDQMQAGYAALARDEETEACRVWLACWKNLRQTADARNIQSVRDLDDVFEGTQSVFNWFADVRVALHNAGLEDPTFWKELIALCEYVLGRLNPEEHLRRNFRSDLAHAYFDAGMPEKGEQLYQQWLREDPRWGWGWIGWSDCYGLFARQDKDPAKAELHLKQGLAVPDVRDREYLLDRLRILYEEAGRHGEAGALGVQLQALKQPKVQVTTKATPAGTQIKETYTFGEQGLPLTQVDQFMKAVRGKKQVPGTPPGKVGRNDPCPCGSGKKFKRCCGTKV